SAGSSLQSDLASPLIAFLQSVRPRGQADRRRVDGRRRAEVRGWRLEVRSELGTCAYSLCAPAGLKPATVLDAVECDSARRTHTSSSMFLNTRRAPYFALKAPVSRAVS